MKKLLLIALGGASGSLLRYLFAESISSYPLAIFLANLTGVFVAGFIAFRATESHLARLFWIPGFAGGMTTFSSVALIHAQKSGMLSIIYFFGTVSASLVILEVLDRKVSK